MEILGRSLVNNQDAKDLAKNLLGKIIRCEEGDYLITVTEAYPANDSYSYIYRATHHEKDDTEKNEDEINKNSKSYKVLTDGNMVGKFFLFGGMLHLAGKENKGKDGTAQIQLDNVLIRGAVKISGNKLIIDENNISMNFGKGKPTALVNTLKINDNNLSSLSIYDSSLSFMSKECERIGLQNEENPEAKAKYRSFIKEFNY